MKYNTIVDKSTDTLELLIDKAQEFNSENVLEGLQQRHYDIEDVRMLLAHVREYHGKLQKEVIALLKFSQNFNQQYATDNNKCFDTASRLFNRLRSSIAGTRRLYRSFCPRINSQVLDSQGNPVSRSIFTHSLLSAPLYSRQLFGLDSYPECVSELCHEMEGFFNDLVAGLKLCRDVLKKEREIRGDYRQVKAIYDNCYLEAVNTSRAMMAVIDRKALTTDEVTARKQKAHSLQEFVSDSFHSIDKSQFTLHAVIDALSKGRDNGLSEIETMLWNDDYDFVVEVRRVITGFDYLSPEGQMDHKTGLRKLSSQTVAMFMQWTGITGTGKEKQFVEDYFNKNYHGNFQVVSSSAVNAAKNRYTAEEYEAFCNRIATLLNDDSIEVKPKLQLVVAG